MNAREISSVELLRHFIQQIESFDGRINAVVSRDFERALDRAKAADGTRARSAVGELGRLHGLPMTVKESFDVSGLPTSWGTVSYAGNVAKRDADAVARLVGAGAVVFGKTNVPEGLADVQTSNPLHGRTSNPWDHARTCGGSSGGSAAALAAGFTAVELGSDLAGSLRVPAHFCGVFSHKPSYGLVPQNGHSIDADESQTDMTVLGPMARSASDLRLLLEILAGPGGFDAGGWVLQLPKARGNRLSDFRVAVLPNHGACEVDQGIQASIENLARALQRSGAEVDFDVEWPVDLELCFQDFMMMTRAVGSRRASPDLLKRMSDEAMTLRSDDRSYRAAIRRAAGMSHHAWLSLHSRRSEYRAAWQRFFRSYDVVLCPVHASLAFVHDTAGPRENRLLDINGRQQDYSQSLFWMAIAGLSYLPSTVRPVSLVGGLPTGVQIIGPYLEDMTTLRFAELLDELCPHLTYPFQAAGSRSSVDGQGSTGRQAQTDGSGIQPGILRTEGEKA
ncbi:Amidase [Rhodopseudomonas palustris HaA2]|uniref:Amidase n=2 Tax=Rhodopseudomonas palustris TaxID=1076 RepID=Q2J2A8_RHOP2|nr:Amidase [Rhodopseudomonas palustris HaA2]